MPDKYARFARTETKRSETTSGGVTPTDTLDPSTILATEVELDISGRPRTDEVEVPKEVILVDWDGEDDPENPLNWCVASILALLLRGY